VDEIRVKKSNEPLSFLVRDKIIELIEKKELLPNVKLPTEEEFAGKLGVSRGVLREAYRLLEEDGFIIRRPGVGTFVVNKPRVVKNPLESNFSVTEIIESMGATAGARDIKIKYEKAGSYISKKLEIKIGTPIVIVERTRTANEKPVVYAINIIPRSILGKEEKLEEFEGSFYELLEEKYNQKVSYSVAKIIPTIADNKLSVKLKISLGAPLLLIEQVTYNENNVPLLYAREYWVKDAFEFTILRRPKR